MNSAYLAGKNIYLRPVEISDAPLIQSWHNDPELRKLAGSPRVSSTLDNEEEDIKNASKSENEAYLMIVKKADNVQIGFIRLNELEDRVVWLRIVIGDKGSWGKGYGSEAMRYTLYWLFRKLNVHRVELEAFASNTRAISFFKKIGFKSEGVRREAHFTGDRYEDIIFFGLLKKEFHIKL